MTHAGIGMLTIERVSHHISLPAWDRFVVQSSACCQSLARICICVHSNPGPRYATPTTLPDLCAVKKLALCQLTV